MLGQPRPNALTALAREGDALAPVSLGRAVVAAAYIESLTPSRRPSSDSSAIVDAPGDGMPFPKAAPAWFNAEQEAAAGGYSRPPPSRGARG
jgi:hypothetical protein